MDSNPAIALGGLSIGVTPLDMATAFGTLANNGVHAIPRSIYKMTDADGNVIVENNPETHKILDAKVAAKINGILSQVVSSGTGTGAKIGRPQAGKTGTTEDNADAWFVGYTPDLVTAVWVGYPQGRIPMRGMVGGNMPATIWRTFMSQALEGVPPTPFPKVEGESDDGDTESRQSIWVTICQDSGLLATPNCPHTSSREFTRGEEPTAFCNLHAGPSASTVPGVTGMSQSEAQTALTQAGYRVSVVSQSSSQVAAGSVISQSPAAGTSHPAGGTVTIVVSEGGAVVHRSQRGRALRAGRQDKDIGLRVYPERQLHGRRHARDSHQPESLRRYETPYGLSRVDRCRLAVRDRDTVVRPRDRPLLRTVAVAGRLAVYGRAENATSF